MSQPIVSIIDDHKASREGLQALLSVHGHKTELFSSANKFREIGQRAEHGCIITDLRMDDFDGLELLIQLQSENTLLPIILVSAYATVSEAVEIMKQGALTLLQKPYKEQEILNAVKLALEKNSQKVAELARTEHLNKQFGNLSDEEFPVMELMVSGDANKMIAYKRGVSERTIDRKKTSIFEKLKIKSVTELTMLYVEWYQSKKNKKSKSK